MTAERLFRQSLRLSLVLTLIVIVLGAWVRLSDAGLGCPDWPGCYGRLLAPTQAPHIERANEVFPERPVEGAKAWKEMVHRYAAGMLGLLVLFMAVLAWRGRRRPGQPVVLPFVLLGVVIFQAALGMWTVTLQLKPAIVTAHLLGGFTTLALLWWMVLSTRRAGPPEGAAPRAAGPLVLVALAVLVVQITLGGWVSTNYAALACPDFPKCQMQWWPENTDFSEGFVLWRGTGVDYEFGVLDGPARTAIHLTHRIGALTTLLVLGGLGLWLLARARGAVRAVAGAVLVLLVAQLSLGISNVVFYLPLPVAVAHNAGAALLLLSVLALIYVLRSPRVRTAAS